MKLSAYLGEKNLSPAAFAAKAGLPASTITRIIKGERTPRLETISKIEAATAGLVGISDWYPRPAPVSRKPRSPEPANGKAA